MVGLVRFFVIEREEFLKNSFRISYYMIEYEYVYLMFFSEEI